MRRFAHGSWTLIVSNADEILSKWGGVCDWCEIWEIRYWDLSKMTKQSRIRGCGQKTQKIPILIYILKTQSINQVYYFTKNGHLDFSLQFQGKLGVPKKVVAKKVATGHFRVTWVTSVTRKSGHLTKFLATTNQLDTDKLLSNAFSLKIFFLPSDFRTALSIPESLSRK